MTRRDGAVVQRLDHRLGTVFGYHSGAPSGRAMVMVHGIGIGARTYARLAAQLASTGRLIRVELPGFGHSPKPLRRLSIEEHADVLAAYLDRFGEGPAILIGHSMGTQIVTELAVRRADLVDRVVLIGPVTDPGARTALRQGIRLAHDTMGEPPMTNQVVFADYLRCGPRWYGLTLPSMLHYDLEGPPQGVACPALVLRGDRDPIAPRPWTERVTKAFRAGRAAEIPGAHHVAMFTHAVQVAALVRAFAADGPLP